MELCQQTSERMVLSCEISRPNAVVRWYRNGLEVEENNNLILEVDGVYRRLIIPKTTVKDSAEYVCDTTDDSMTFFVNIAGMDTRNVPQLCLYQQLLLMSRTFLNPRASCSLHTIEKDDQYDRKGSRGDTGLRL